MYFASGHACLFTFIADRFGILYGIYGSDTSSSVIVGLLRLMASVGGIVQGWKGSCYWRVILTRQRLISISKKSEKLSATAVSREMRSSSQASCGFRITAMNALRSALSVHCASSVWITLTFILSISPTVMFPARGKQWRKQKRQASCALSAFPI